MCFAPHQRALFQHLNVKKWSEPFSCYTFDLEMCFAATTACTFSTSQRQKVVRARQFLTLLTCKCASRHDSAHFFDISTAKNVPTVACFVHFGLGMCFAPQRRALFQHLNFQKWSEQGVLCTFWLGNVLRATTVCNFSSLIWPDGSAPAASASLLFRPSGAPNHWKNTVNCDFPTFHAPASSCFPLFLFSDLLPSWLLLPDSSHLCFSISAYCRKFDF